MREAWGFHDAEKSRSSALYGIALSKLGFNSHGKFFSLGARAWPSGVRLPGRTGNRPLGARSSMPSLEGILTGLLDRTRRWSLVAKCIFPICFSLTVLLLPFTFCASDTLLRFGALLAESSGITSPDEYGFSLAATRDGGALIFAPDVVDSRRLLSAAFLPLAEVDMSRIYPLTSVNFYGRYFSSNHYRHGVVSCGLEKPTRLDTLCILWLGALFQPYQHGAS